MTFGPANSLLAALAAGKAEAYAALYDRMAERLLRVAMAILQDRAEAEDAVQDVFMNLVRHRERFGRVVDLEAYVFAVLRHAAGDRLEKRRVEMGRLRRLPMAVATADVATVGMGEAEDLRAALGALPAEQREIVALKIDAGLTFAQIGEIVRISPNTAASRYRYALEKLRSLLER